MNNEEKKETMSHEEMLDTLKLMREEVEANRRRNQIKNLFAGNIHQQRRAIYMMHADAVKEKSE